MFMVSNSSKASTKDQRYDAVSAKKPFLVIYTLSLETWKPDISKPESIRFALPC